jgi:CRP/FNR family transcriptional regulator
MDMKLKIPYKLEVTCSNCNLLKKCMPLGLNNYELTRIDGLVSQRIRVKRGHDLSRLKNGQPSLYIIRTGYFKTVISTNDGRDQVLGFHMAGDSIGLAGELSELYSCQVIALEDSTVCIVPFSNVEEIANSVKGLHSHIRHLYSLEINRENSVMLFLGSMNSEERVATFLLKLSASHEERGFSPIDLNLKMSRYDIASYLGLKHETVSRTLAKFIKSKLIILNLRELKILNLVALNSIATDKH